MQESSKWLINSSKGKGNRREKVLLTESGALKVITTLSLWNYIYLMKLFALQLGIYVGKYQSSVHSFSLWNLPFILYKDGLEIIKNKSKVWTSDLLVAACQSGFSASTSSLRLVGNILLFIFLKKKKLAILSTDELAEEKCCHNGILKIPLAIADMTVLLFLLLPRWAKTCHLFLPKSFLPHDADTHHFFFFC